jgi:hypothetical protein
MPKSQRDLSWDVVETKKPDASAKRPPPPVDDAVRAHAEWFAWAKRHKADFGRAHGAARKAVAASERGLPAAEVEKAAREAIAAGDTTPVDETRQAYSAWFAVAAVDMAMEPAKAHTFAQAGYAAQRDGADVKTATSIAEAAVAPPPPPPPSMAPPPPPPPPPGAIDPGAFATVPMAPRPGTFPPQPPVDLGDWGPPPGAPTAPAHPPLPPAAPPLPPVSEQADWRPPTPFTPPPPPATPTVETPTWSTPTSPPPSAAPPPPPPPAAAAPPARPADPGAWAPPTKLSPPPPPRPAPTRKGAIEKAVADTKVVRPTRSEAKLVTYGELKKATKRTLRSDHLPEEVKVWVVAVAGTLTSLAEPVAGHAVAYLAADQRAGIGYDIHTGSGWPAWFDDLPDQATE